MDAYLTDPNGIPVLSTGFHETAFRGTSSVTAGEKFFTPDIAPERTKQPPAFLVIITPAANGILSAVYTASAGARSTKLFGGSELTAGVEIATMAYPQLGETLNFTFSVDGAHVLSAREV
jgi:hypothetical protein